MQTAEQAQQELAQVAHDLGFQYDHFDTLDKGGMGVLYRARKISLNAEVVIKRAKSKFKGKFDEKSEAMLLTSLKHSYLPRIYDIVESPSGYIYTVMDYIPGMNLKQYVEKYGAIDQKKAYKWLCQLCEVVDYLHSQTPPIIHCDIKPSNLMITPEDNICLIDFNTSLIFSEGVVAIGATPGYAAPEQYTKRAPAQPAPAPVSTAFAQTQVLPGDGTLPLDPAATLPLETGATLPLSYETPMSAPAAGETQGTDQSLSGSMGTTGSVGSASATAAQATMAGNYGSIARCTDVYAIGATFYYALTAARPEHALKPQKQLHEFRLKLSPAFVQIIERAMQTRQEMRFSDAKEMLRALQDVGQLDAGYQRVKRLTFTAVAAEIVLAAAGAALLAGGIRQRGIERDVEYFALVSQARVEQQAFDYDAANELLLQAIQLQDRKTEAYIDQASILYDQGSYEECVNAARQTLGLQLNATDTQNANCCTLAAASYYELGQYDQAASWYQAALEYAPDQAVLYRDLIISQVKSGQRGEAEKTLEALRQISPEQENSPDYAMIHAELALDDGDGASALDWLDKVLALTDDTQTLSRAYLMAAQTCEQLGSDFLDREITLLEAGCERLGDGKNTILTEMLANAYQKTGQDTTENRERSLTLYEKLISQNRAGYAARQNAAMLQELLGDFAGAESTLNTLQQDYPSDYRVFVRLGLLYADWENHKPGTHDYSRVKSSYEQAKALYNGDIAADAEFLQLKQLADQID